MASSSIAISPTSQTDFRKMNKQALRDALASRGLDTNGLRPSLIQRLESSVKALAAAEALSTSVDSETLTSNTETSQSATLANAPQIGTQTDLDASAEGETHTLSILSETVVVAAEDTLKSQDNTKTQEPITVSGAATKFDATMKVSASKGDTGRVRVTPSSTVENRKSEPKSSNTTHLSDLDRKRMRAERFGVGLQVSEKEKLALRAERFAGAEGKKNSTIREPESEKRKQRAARFGIVDDEARKKAREERFASAPKQDQSVEVDKRKARAARFGATTEPVDSKEK